MKWTSPNTWGSSQPTTDHLNQELRKHMTKQYIALSPFSKPPANPERPHDDPQVWQVGEAVDVSHKTPDEVEMLVSMGVLEEGVPVVVEEVSDVLPGWGGVAVIEDITPPDSPVYLKEKKTRNSPHTEDVEGVSPDEEN